MTKEEFEKENTKLQRACHKWFMRWREAKKDALYFDSSLQKQIEATLKLQQENAELKKELVEKRQLLDLTEREWTKDLNKQIHFKTQLTKAKELLAKWVELFKPKGGNIPPTPIQVETEQFISEVEK